MNYKSTIPITIASAWFLCSYVVAGPKDDMPVFRTEVTRYLGPVGDAHITRVIENDDKLIFMRAYPRGSTQNGEIIEIQRKKTSAVKIICNLGSDSELSKSGRIYHQDPNLIARISDRLFILNLVCGSNFPAREDRLVEPSGNVILFDA